MARRQQEASIQHALQRSPHLRQQQQWWWFGLGQHAAAGTHRKCSGSLGDNSQPQQPPRPARAREWIGGRGERTDNRTRLPAVIAPHRPTSSTPRQNTSKPPATPNTDRLRHFVQLPTDDPRGPAQSTPSHHQPLKPGCSTLPNTHYLSHNVFPAPHTTTSALVRSCALETPTTPRSLPLPHRLAARPGTLARSRCRCCALAGSSVDTATTSTSLAHQQARVLWARNC